MRSSHHPGIEQSTGAATLKLKDGSRVPVGYQENAYVYGTAVCLVVPHDPSCQRAQAAAGPEWTVFPRANCMKMWNGSTPAKHRFIHECALAIGRPGISRLGADMWTIAGDKGARNGTPFCRYPASNLSQINLAYASILAPGPDGPMPTTRLEHVREGVQECEARVFIEKALAGGKLPADLARRAQATLDERTRVLRLLNLNETGMYLWYPGSGWQERTRRLYETAAETAVSMNVEP
jgi:hypothetical protein